MKKLLVLMLTLVMACSFAFAQGAEETAVAEWPQGTVQVVVSSKAGGGTDLVARILAAKMQEKLGSTVIVSNVTDGGGAIAFQQVMDDDADTLKLGFNIPSFFTSYITGAIDMDPLKDFQCASFLTLTDCNYFAVAADSPWQTMEEVMAYLKENPNGLTLGLSMGSRTHFTVAEFAQAADVQFKYVEAGKAADATTALLGGHIDMAYLSIANVKSYVESGQMRVLAAQCEPAEPVAALAGVPTFADLGYPDLKCKCDFFFNTSNNAPAETIAKINALLIEVVADPEVKESLLKLGYAAEALDVAATQAGYEASYNTFQEVGVSLGVAVN